MKTKLLCLVLFASHPVLRACGDLASLDGYVAHEWGTFTSVQGADGVQFEWRPNAGADLPKFVHTYLQPDSSECGALSVFAFSKSVHLARQRMETPVIYFYSPRAMSVDVRVDFPDGIVTEWFPRVTRFGPSAAASTASAPRIPESFIEWKNVRVLAPGAQASLPIDGTRNHYFAARATDANPLAFGDAEKGVEHEKLLFYRGLGHFQAPLQAGLNTDEDQLLLRNTGSSPLTHLFVLTVRQNQAKFARFARMDGGGKIEAPFEPDKGLRSVSQVAGELSAQLERALVEQGLFAKEAAAMVATWRDSWFEEPGLRVLYLLPRAWTDAVLPLKLEPKPRSLVRVMVGRAELIPPSKEWQLLKQIVQFSADNPAARTLAVDGARRLELGRFTEPAVIRALGRSPSKEFSEAAWGLLRAMSDEPAAAAAAPVR